MRLIEKRTEYPSMKKIFDALCETEDAVFLDSSLTGELGQYSVIGFCPYKKLVKDGERFTVNGTENEMGFEAYLKRYMKKHRFENETGLPLLDGAIGYFSYDYGREKAGVISRHPKTLMIPEAVLVFYDVYILEDIRKRELTVVVNGFTEDARSKMRKMLMLLEVLAGDETKPACGPVQPCRVRADFDRETYKQAVEHMIRSIVEGEIYVVNMTQQMLIESSRGPYEMFTRLRENNPSPFGAYMNYGDFQVISASMERFLQMKDGHVKTRPIKGTRRRGETPQEDAALRRELAQSEKDQSELLMIVDLERNDLNRVCAAGSVQVTELFEVEDYATVFHLVANVEGDLRPELGAMDLIEAAFPGGSITGAPKLRAMERIDEEEKSRRNLYTGAIGYLSLNGDCDLSIVIRTVVHKDGVYHLGAGGGITCESDPDFEYEEVFQKAKALLAALS